MKKMLDLTGKRKTFYIISSVLVLLTIIFSFVFGVQLDIQFKGGSIISYTYSGTVDKAAVESFAAAQLNQTVSVQETEDAVSKASQLVLSLPASENLSSAALADFSDKLAEQFPDNKIEVLEISNVNPVIGKEFLVKCLLAVALAFLLMVIYIAFRFKKIGGWSAGTMAIVALLHDVLMVYATFVICRFPINDNFIAAVLTILGYSINNTIVIYDRIRENKPKFASKMTLEQIVNLSLNQSLARSINTSIATTVLALTVICIMGAVYRINTIITFAFPLIIGMLSGLYSSLCIAPQLWVTWQNYKKNKKAKA